MLRLLGIFVFAWAGAQIWLVMANTPVFNSQMRETGVAGDWRLQLGSMQFDRGTYLFQLGYGYANANDNFALDDAPGDPAGGDLLEKTEAQKTQAVALLRESVSLDPGNAHAWAQLAWAETGIGNIAEARAAMAVSWKIAPYNAELSASRPDFLALVDEILRFEADYADAADAPATILEAELSAAGRDIGLLAARDYDLAEEIAQASDLLLPLLPPRPQDGS